MVLGLVTGFMNLAWMACMGMIAILERLLPEPRPVIYGCGAGLIAAGSVLFLFGG